MAAPDRLGDQLDELTLARAQRGEPAACRALVERYQRPVFALISRMLAGRDPAAIEDLAQETFLRAFRALPRFDAAGPARLSSWILSIAARLSIDELRRKPAPVVDLDAAAGLAAAERADETLARRALQQAILRALAELAPEYRAAFLLREAHGLEYAEIARSLGIDLGTVKSRLARARVALREALGEVHDG
jgi:RNA polymerase sigma-70 factor (ECF subfamily)